VSGAGLKFFVDVTLGQPEVMAKMQHVHLWRGMQRCCDPMSFAPLSA